MMAASDVSKAGQAGTHQQSGLVSHNVAGGTLVICELLKHFKPLVLCLQEVKISTKELNTIVNRLNYKGQCNIDPEFPNQCGTAIVWRSDLCVSGDTRVIVSRRVQSLTLGTAATSKEEQCTVINVYAPTGTAGKKEWEDIFAGPLSRELRNLGPKYILMGDWNSVISVQDVENNFAAKRSPATAQLVETFALTDAYRHKFPMVRSYTFYRASVTRSRLDRGYLSPALVHSLLTVSHKPILSDHAALVYPP